MGTEHIKSVKQCSTCADPVHVSICNTPHTVAVVPGCAKGKGVTRYTVHNNNGDVVSVYYVSDDNVVSYNPPSGWVSRVCSDVVTEFELGCFVNTTTNVSTPVKVVESVLNGVTTVSYVNVVTNTPYVPSPGEVFNTECAEFEFINMHENIGTACVNFVRVVNTTTQLVVADHKFDGSPYVVTNPNNVGPGECINDVLQSLLVNIDSNIQNNVASVSPDWYIGDNGSFLGYLQYDASGNPVNWNVVNGNTPSSVSQVASNEYIYSITTTVSPSQSLHDVLVTNCPPFNPAKVLSISIKNKDMNNDLVFENPNKGIGKTILDAGLYETIEWGNGQNYPLNDKLFHDIIFQSTTRVTFAWEQGEI